MKIVLVLVTTLVCAPAFADEVADAYKLCKVMDSTGLTTGCEVNVGWGGSKSVDVTIDMDSDEARDLCAKVSDQMAAGTDFNGAWKLRILSPYSGDSAIAVCALR